MTSTVDRTIDAAADKLQSFVESARRDGGMKAKLAAALEDDPAFLRKLKPSLIAARAKGEAPPPESAETAPRQAPSGPQLERPQPRKKKRSRRGGPNPWLIVGIAFVAGMLGAKALDWRGHAHPR
jgi:hypothetical protein